MKEYNDEALNPESFALLASKYSDIKSNFFFYKVRQKDSTYSELKKDRHSLETNISCYANILKKFNHLQKNTSAINNIIVQSKEWESKSKSSITATDYCDTIKKMVKSCCKLSTICIALKSYCLEKEQNELEDCIVKINQLCEDCVSLLGSCKYRY